MSGEELKRDALIDGLLDRIHWQVDAEVKREDIVELIDSLDEYGMAFVSIPQWTCASDTQRAVDAYYKGSADPRLIDAVRSMVEGKFSTYRARNGREVGVQGDDGEKVWLVHSELMFELESAYEAIATRAHRLTEQPQEGDAAAEIAFLKQRLESAERHLSFWAKRPTIAEVIEGKGDIKADTVEARIEEMGRRKREHDDAILAARAFLQEQDKQNG